jgi:hypothetical protein
MKLGCGDIDATTVQKLDSIDALGDLQRIGKVVAVQRVKATSTLAFSSPRGLSVNLTHVCLSSLHASMSIFDVAKTSIAESSRASRRTVCKARPR